MRVCMMTDEVLSHGTAERMLPEQDQLVEALTFDRPERPLNVSVHIRAVEYFLDGCAYRIDDRPRIAMPLGVLGQNIVVRFTVRFRLLANAIGAFNGGNVVVTAVFESSCSDDSNLANL